MILLKQNATHILYAKARNTQFQPLRKLKHFVLTVICSSVYLLVYSDLFIKLLDWSRRAFVTRCNCTALAVHACPTSGQFSMNDTKSVSLCNCCSLGMTGSAGLSETWDRW